MSYEVESLASPSEVSTSPVRVGESCQRTLSFSAEQIAQFAHLTGDANPVHADERAAASARHGRIIASGQQTTSQMIGLAATYFSRGHGRDSHESRELLCLNFNFALKSPVFADTPVNISWQVASSEWHGRLQGWIVQINGHAHSHDELCVVARGTLLIKRNVDAD